MLADDIGGLEAARESLARERLEELQALARTYRNWSVKELAHALGRQPGRLVPESGMPKIDLVVGLAKALDWPVEAVVDHLIRPASSDRHVAIRHDAATDYPKLYNDSIQKRLERDYTEAIRLAVRAHAVADTPNRIAAALIVEAQTHESMGSFAESVRCLREAVRVEGTSVEWRLYGDAHLANIVFMQGNSTQSLGIATSVLEYGDRLPPTTVSRTTRMLAHWSRGNVLRTAIPMGQTSMWRSLAESARSDFHAAQAIGTEIVAEIGENPIYCTTFVSCIEPLVLELDAICDEDRAGEAMRGLLAMVRETDHGPLGRGARKAWAAIALAATVKRFMTDEMQIRGLLEIASATLRAHAVATSNWYFAQQHLEMDAERRRGFAANGVAPRALDAVEAKLIAGVLGHIPAARRRADEFMSMYANREGGRA